MNNSIDLGKITTYQAGAAQAAMHRALQKVCDDILKPFGITKMQWLIIGTVLDAGSKGMRVSDMAQSLGTTIPYVTTAINLLESRHMLLRIENDNDSRSRLVIIHPSFAPKTGDIEATLRNGLRKTIYAGIDVNDFRTYMKVLYQLKDVAQVAESNAA